MKGNRDEILDLVLKNFQNNANDAVKKGYVVYIDSCLENAISETRLRGYGEKSIRECIGQNSEFVKQACNGILVKLEKKARMLEIRKTSVNVMVGDFVREAAGFRLSYKLRDNNTVGFSAKSPFTGQSMRFSMSYSRILSDGWQESLLRDIQSFIDITEHLGRIRVSVY